MPHGWGKRSKESVRARDVICGTVEICAQPDGAGAFLVTVEADLDDAGVGRSTHRLDVPAELLAIQGAAAHFAAQLVRDMGKKLRPAPPGAIERSH